MELKRRDPAVIILSALLDGLPVTIGNVVYRLDDGFHLCIEAEEPKGQLLKVLSCELNYFITLCKQASDEEICAVVSNLVLNKE